MLVLLHSLSGEGHPQQPSSAPTPLRGIQRVRFLGYNIRGRRWTKADTDDVSWDVSASHRDDTDSVWLKNEVRKVVSEICRKAGRSERDIQAYIGYVLDEKSPDEILTEVKNFSSASNLYRIASQIKDILIASRENFRDAYNELVAA